MHRRRAVTTGVAEVSELTDEQIRALMDRVDLAISIGASVDGTIKTLIRSAYALGREAGLKEAVEVCDQTHEGRWSAYRGAGYCADAISALIDKKEG
jgi:pyridoxal/pyridoxine/pyridoxamine kinase